MTSASPTILPMLIKVKLFVTALFDVIPFVSFNFKAIVPVVGSVVESVCNEKLISSVDITLMNYWRRLCEIFFHRSLLYFNGFLEGLILWI